MPEIAKRVLTALIAAPVFVGVTWLGGWVFVAVTVAIILIIQLEMIQIVEKQNVKIQKPFALLMGSAVFLMGLAPEIAWIFFLFLILLVMVTDMFFSGPDSWREMMFLTAVAVLIPALFSGLLMMRFLGDDYTGFVLTLTLLLMVWTNDVFAYFGGRLMGRNQLAPIISPKKTVEGFIWGFLGCFVALAVCIYFIPGYPLAWPLAIPFAVIVGVMGPLGDLAESKLKRASAVKDSSGLMPGHGGFYDRFDAVLFAAPASLIYFKLLIYFSMF